MHSIMADAGLALTSGYIPFRTLAGSALSWMDYDVTNP